MWYVPISTKSINYPAHDQKKYLLCQLYVKDKEILTYLEKLSN